MTNNVSSFSRINASRDGKKVPGWFGSLKILAESTTFQRMMRPSTRRCSFSTIRKPFLGERDVHYVGFGHDFGAQLGSDVNHKLISDLIAASPEGLTTIADTFAERVVDQIKDLIARNTSVAIVIFGRFEVEQLIAASRDFTPRWMSADQRFTFPEFEGTLAGAPVFRADYRWDRERKGALVFGLPHCATLLHTRSTTLDYGGIAIRVREIGPEQTEQQIAADPERFKKPDGSPLTGAEAVMELRQKVDVFVGALYQFAEIHDDYVKWVQLGS